MSGENRKYNITIVEKLKPYQINQIFDNIKDLSLWDNTIIKEVSNAGDIELTTKRFEIVLSVIKKLKLDKELPITLNYIFSKVEMFRDIYYENKDCKTKMNKGYFQIYLEFQVYDNYQKDLVDIVLRTIYPCEKTEITQVELKEKEIINALQKLFNKAITCITYTQQQLEKALDYISKIDYQNEEYEEEYCKNSEVLKYLKGIYENNLTAKLP